MATDFLLQRQIRAARALLDWSQERLAKESLLALSTIRRLEQNGFKNPNKSTLAALFAVFEKNGITFSTEEKGNQRVSIVINALIEPESPPE